MPLATRIRGILRASSGVSGGDSTDVSARAGFLAGGLGKVNRRRCTLRANSMLLRLILGDYRANDHVPRW